MYVGGDSSLVSWEWAHAHMRPAGPLGTAYPYYDGGDCFGGPPGRVRGVTESDTPSFVYLVPTGLSDPMHPQWGSWGGRFVRSGTGNQYEDAPEVHEGELSRP
ncbi:MAG: nucleoside hydrolase-like domain-containing protein [Planctomycetota bacterium]